MKTLLPFLRLSVLLALAGSSIVSAQAPTADAGVATTDAAVEVAPVAEAPVAEPVAPPSEICTNGADEDGDTMVDCADADCYEADVCEAGQSSERNNERCSDFIDNDNDGITDCEDSDCRVDPVNVCEGSAARMSHMVQADDHALDLPMLSGDMAAEELIGTHGDANGERDDYSCSDGVDNDNDGRADCQDFGCRFDPSITVCTASPSFRFGVVAGIGASYDFGAPAGSEADVNFTRLQLRALGPIPFIENSFFLINFRAEKSFRMTFAHFQVPIGPNGHYFALNSGSGTLSSALTISTSKQPLLDPAYYLVNAFEQGNGAVLEFGGPLMAGGRILYKAFVGGGSGFSNGNVGGRFFRNNNQNFTYVVGAQFQFNVIGHFARFDSPLLYDSSPAGLGLWLGVKYDQRATERYPAANASAWFRYGLFSLRAETYAKYAIDFGGSFGIAWNAQASILLWPKRLFLAADIGSFVADPYSDLPSTVDDRPNIVRDQLQIRAALHFWWYRNIGLLTLMYDHAQYGDDGNPGTPELERQLRLEAQFRF